MELTAVYGELPTDLLIRLHESISYLEAVIRRLKKDKLLQVYYRDKVLSYRLCVKAKDFLLADNYDRFSFYLTGNSDTNILKSELPRRLRLHRLVKMYALMLNGGVAVFRYQKPYLFSPDGYAGGYFHSPAFCSYREIKETGLETVKIHGSRMGKNINHNRDLSEITQKAYFSILNGENIASVRFAYDKATDAYWKRHMWDD